MNKFDRLANIVIKETSSYNLNPAGRELLQQYYALIHSIEEELIPILKPLVNDVDRLKKEISIQIISTINSQQAGTPQFEIMSRLDTLTNGGSSPISPEQFSFNQNDPILKYLASEQE